MLVDILRFNRQSLELLQAKTIAWSWATTCNATASAEQFIENYLVPMGAAIWSVPPEQFRRFPARFIVGFFNNHGLLSVSGHPRWKTVEGGAVQYVKALTSPFADRIRLNCPVVSVRRGPDRVTVASRQGSDEDFDAVVLAAHSDQSLAVLADATETERAVLGAIPYQRNETVVHVDPSLLPRCKRAWASWNYRIPRREGQPVALTYNLNRLQGHDSPRPDLRYLERHALRRAYEDPAADRVPSPGL